MMGWEEGPERKKDDEQDNKPLTWQDQPTEDGEYWLRMKNEKATIVCVYNMGRGEHEESVCYFGSDMDESVCSITGKWYGPITPPKEN